MDQPFDIGTADKPIVFVRSVKSADLPAQIRDQVGDVAEVYAILDEKGNYVALARDRDMAFDLAHFNDLSPMSVH